MSRSNRNIKTPCPAPSNIIGGGSDIDCPSKYNMSKTNLNSIINFCKNQHIDNDKSCMFTVNPPISVGGVKCSDLLMEMRNGNLNPSSPPTGTSVAERVDAMVNSNNHEILKAQILYLLCQLNRCTSGIKTRRKGCAGDEQFSKCWREETFTTVEAQWTYGLALIPALIIMFITYMWIFKWLRSGVNKLSIWILVLMVVAIIIVSSSVAGAGTVREFWWTVAPAVVGTGFGQKIIDAIVSSQYWNIMFGLVMLTYWLMGISMLGFYYPQFFLTYLAFVFIIYKAYKSIKSGSGLTGFF